MQFRKPLTVGAVGHYSIQGAGAPATTFNYTGSGTSATATAGASWTGGSWTGSAWSGGSTSLTLSATAPTFIPTMLGEGVLVSVWDTSGPWTTPTYVGTVASVSGATVTLNFGAANASAGSSDGLMFTVDLLTLNPTGSTAANQQGVNLKDFRLTSSTPLSGGFALHAQNIWNGFSQNIMLGGSGVGDSGDLCGGFWGDQISGWEWIQPGIASNRLCGDAMLVNAAPWYGQGATAELQLHSGGIGGLASGIHMAGGFGGARCDGTNIAGNVHGFVVDNSVAPINNREIDLGSTCAIDSSTGDGVLIQRSAGQRGTVDIAGWIGSSNGYGVNIKKWSNGKVQLRGHELYNNCGSGLYVQDTSTYVAIGDALEVNNNGLSASGCWRGRRPIRATATGSRRLRKTSGSTASRIFTATRPDRSTPTPACCNRPSEVTARSTSRR